MQDIHFETYRSKSNFGTSRGEGAKEASMMEESWVQFDRPKCDRNEHENKVDRGRGRWIRYRDIRKNREKKEINWKLKASFSNESSLTILFSKEIGLKNESSLNLPFKNYQSFRFAQLRLERKKGLLNLTIMCRSSFEIRGKSIFEKTVLATDNSSGEQLKITGNKRNHASH